MVAHQVGKAMKAADRGFRRTNATSCVVKPTSRTIDTLTSLRERKTGPTQHVGVFVFPAESSISRSPSANSTVHAAAW